MPTPFGHSLPPEGAHTITFHIPTWETATGFRDGDASIISRLKSVYPRFFPFGPSAQFMQAVSKQLNIPQDHAIVAFLSPAVWAANKEHATSEFRKDKKLTDDEMKYHVVEIGGVRLYVLELLAAKMMAGIFMWQHGGLGFSTRLGEHMLLQIDSLEYLGEFPQGANAPAPTYLPEGEAHELLRKRITGLLMRACAEEPKKSVQPDDVFLYQTGMAGIVRFHETVMKVRSEPAVVFGAVFHSTFHYFEELPSGLKHYGKCDENDVNDFEKYLEEGGKCSYVFTEFPSNPILVSADLRRLRTLADKYGFWIVVDETLSSFCNIDVLPVADAIITSLTKSFSGYADVMAGSVVLNPNMASYSTLKPLFTQQFHNELFAVDADHLLKNSDDYLPRSIILNRNAEALTKYFQKLAEDPKYPVAKVLYPPYSQGSKHLIPFLRKPTPEFPKIGYGCLFSVEFETENATIAFYDNLKFHQGPHLGAHLTLAMPYNFMVLDKESSPYHASYGMHANQIRFSVGLEEELHLVDVCEKAITAMMQTGAQV
ncbi:cystathionine gamma-synthase [Pseudomassariella vexata]|uniref:Cystathionine gamma-synthase n=1 Tax=Pseudomassariella vexata TaxID=1141098 RepID=A0A1Y2DEC7_9PEZI|nr:cystathionine gamma-synthase [Pseudomassariella vexata]ORY57476.1 cystathionine gamma-synthase [Pseudomassariella vexata]